MKREIYWALNNCISQTIAYLCTEGYRDNNIEALKEFIGDFRTVTRNYAKKQINWYRKDDSFLWLQMDRSQGTALEACDKSAREILHWMDVSIEEYNKLTQDQVRRGFIFTLYYALYFKYCKYCSSA